MKSHIWKRGIPRGAHENNDKDRETSMKEREKSGGRRWADAENNDSENLSVALVFFFLTGAEEQSLRRRSKRANTAH